MMTELEKCEERRAWFIEQGGKYQLDCKYWICDPQHEFRMRYAYKSNLDFILFGCGDRMCGRRVE